MITKKKYSINVTTTEPFRIGGKSDPLSEAENPVAIVGGRVCIPGPSLKGALRSELERFLNNKYYDFQNKTWPNEDLSLRPCIPATRLTPDERRLVSEKRFRRIACHYPCDIGERGKCGKTKEDCHSICPVCYLLGAQGLTGFVQVPFLFGEISYDELYSARLDRTSRTVVRGTNRSYQLIPPETQFKGTLEILLTDTLLGWNFGQARNLQGGTEGDAWLNGDEWSSEKIMKEFIIDRIMAINDLGGYKSKGFGSVNISAKEVT